MVVVVEGVARGGEYPRGRVWPKVFTTWYPRPHTHTHARTHRSQMHLWNGPPLYERPFAKSLSLSRPRSCVLTVVQISRETKIPVVFTRPYRDRLGYQLSNKISAILTRGRVTDAMTC